MKTQVLLLENDVPLRDSLALALRSEDFEVITLPDPVDALRRLQEQQIDAVLMDVDAPDRDGWMDLRRIATNQMFLPVVAITAKNGQQLRAAMTGADVLFEKPLCFLQLMETLKQLLCQTREGRLFRLEEAYSTVAA